MSCLRVKFQGRFPLPTHTKSPRIFREAGAVHARIRTAFREEEDMDILYWCFGKPRLSE
jgi:hypothetical protein